MSYDHDVVKFLRYLACFLILWIPIGSEAQVTRRSPERGEESGLFGSKFFDNLRSLFGRLQQSELQRAFQRAKPIHCSDLVGETGEWKEVAFLNDDRRLGDWHFDSIEEVKRDLVTFVFEGRCSSEGSPMKVVTSYPVEESVKQFEAGRIPFSKVVINENGPVSVVFDRSTDAYTFTLPYLYRDPGNRSTTSDPLYTLIPPLLTSKPERNVALEFRCKAISDTELTYRFLLCRTRITDRDARDTRDARQSSRPSLGSAAYYILSDGKEASSSVKLSFGGDVDSTPEPPAPTAQPHAPEPDIVPAKTTWTPAASQARLVDVGKGQFRLRFNSHTWSGRIEKPQLLTAEMLLDSAASKPTPNKAYCAWRPASQSLAKQLLEKPDDGTAIYSLEFKKDRPSVISALFDVQNENGRALGVLQCDFPQSQTPADVTVSRWISVVGKHIELEVR